MGGATSWVFTVMHVRSIEPVFWIARAQPLPPRPGMLGTVERTVTAFFWPLALGMRLLVACNEFLEAAGQRPHELHPARLRARLRTWYIRRCRRRRPSWGSGSSRNSLQSVAPEYIVDTKPAASGAAAR